MSNQLNPPSWNHGNNSVFNAYPLVDELVDGFGILIDE